MAEQVGAAFMSTHASICGDLAIAASAARLSADADAMLPRGSTGGAWASQGGGRGGDGDGTSSPAELLEMETGTSSLGGTSSSIGGLSVPLTTQPMAGSTVGSEGTGSRPPLVPSSVMSRTLSDSSAITRHPEASAGLGPGGAASPAGGGRIGLVSSSSSGTLQFAVSVPDCTNPLLQGKKILLLEPCVMIRQVILAMWTIWAAKWTGTDGTCGRGIHFPIIKTSWNGKNLSA